MEFIKCEYCNGEGWIMGYSHYGQLMPNEEKHFCEYCKGQGKLVVIPDGYRTINESEIKKD